MSSKRFSLAAVAFVAALSAGCGGDAGVGNGTIQGTVLGARAGFSGATGISGVTVTAERLESPSVIRTTVSNAFGNYELTRVPTGTYTLNFSGVGFARDPFSRPVQVFVGPSGQARAPDVFVTPTFASGGGNVVVSVVDAVTGDAVSNATVTVGVVSASFGSSGVYTLSVPVTADSFGQPAAQRILVSDDGHLPGSEQPSTVVPIAGQTVSVTVRVTPSQSVVQGVLRASAFDDLYRQNGTFSRVSITSDSIDPLFLNPIVDPATGRFSVRVPASSTTVSRRFSLIFTAQGFFVKVLSGLIAPRSGATANLSSDVILEPATTTLEGTVVTSSGSLPVGAFDQVSILELGQVTGLSSGAFFFSRVPVGIPLTVRASATNPFRPGFPETGTVRVTPVDNGTGRFVVGAIATR